jgi:SAM-dependent methyltransferase
MKQITIDTYNNSAKELAEYFRGIGSRIEDIELAIKLSGVDKPDVLEIGCGDGRDAKEIVTRSGSYLGFDISSELLKIARNYVPSAKFIEADATDFDYGTEKYDVVFAFASLLHLNKNEIEIVLEKVHKSLKSNGIVFISLKLSDKYEEKVKQDKFGTRIFYYYNPAIIKGIIKENYKIVREDGGFKTVGNTEWFETVLQKK